MILERRWESLTGHPVADLVAEVRSLVGDEDRIVHIGTDSQIRGRHANFVTVVCVLDPGRGGRVFYQRVRVEGTQELAQRLFREAQLSVETATALDVVIPQEIIVHIDANEDHLHRSARYVKALAGMVIGYGFQVRLKPHSWCASQVADRVVKGRVA